MCQHEEVTKQTERQLSRSVIKWLLRPGQTKHVNWSQSQENNPLEEFIFSLPHPLWSHRTHQSNNKSSRINYSTKISVAGNLMFLKCREMRHTKCLEIRLLPVFFCLQKNLTWMLEQTHLFSQKTEPDRHSSLLSNWRNVKACDRPLTRPVMSTRSNKLNRKM